jgi:alpha-glucosidase
MISIPPPLTWLSSIHHDGSDLYVSNLYPRLGEKVRLRLRVSAAAPVRHVYLRTFPDGEQAITSMQPRAIEPPVAWWETELLISEPVVQYRFIVAAATESGITGRWSANRS